MPCNCGRNKKTVHQVRASNGVVKKYATEAEARTAAARGGGEYQQVQR